MYPDKDKAERRLEVVSGHIDLLLGQRKQLNNVIEKLEHEKSILYRLLEIYKLEHKDEQ